MRERRRGAARGDVVCRAVIVLFLREYRTPLDNGSTVVELRRAAVSGDAEALPARRVRRRHSGREELQRGAGARVARSTATAQALRAQGRASAAATAVPSMQAGRAGSSTAFTHAPNGQSAAIPVVSVLLVLGAACSATRTFP